MIHLREAFSLAQTKFKRRKFRNFFVAFTISIGSVFILAALFAVSGLLHTGKQIFKDSIAGRYFAAENFHVNGSQGVILVPPTEEKTEDSISSSAEPFVLNTEQYKKENEQFHPIAVFKQLNTQGQNNFGLEGFTKKVDSQAPGVFNQNPSTLTLSATDSLFIQDFLYTGYTLEDSYGDAIPVIIPTSYVVSQQDAAANATQKERVALSKTATSQYLGKTFQMTSSTIDPQTGAFGEPISTDITVIIVGYSVDDQYGGGAYHAASIIFPLWAVEKHQSLQSYFQNPELFTETRAVVEFGNKDDRDRFIKEKLQENMRRWQEAPNPNIAPPPIESYTMPVKGKYEAFADVMTLFKNIAFGVGGFFLAVSAFFVLTTVGKIAADSKKEIGVFRAVGAQKRDIKKIFFAYTFLLSTFGFLFGTVLAVLFDIGLSIKKGEETFYVMLNNGTTLDVPEPMFLFLYIPVQWYLLCYLGAIVIGCIAAYMPVRRASRIDPIKALREE